MGLLDDKVAIITGASSGIGVATARLMAADGAAVVLAARRVDRIEGLAHEIVEAGGTALAIQTDVTSEASVKALFARTVDQFGRVDIQISNAGIGGDIPIDELTMEDWYRTIDTNLTSAFLCAREAVILMKAQGGGRIVNVGSVSSATPRFNSPAYTASKYGLAGLTRSLALDGRPFGITASVVHPGSTITEISEQALAMEPGRRAMAAHDVARVIHLAASLPPGSNMFETMILPIDMPFLGRG